MPRTPLDEATVAHWREQFLADPSAVRAMNAVTRTPIDEVALNRARVVDTRLSMSHRLDDWAATNQQKSGRCWLFAALNLLRADARRILHVKDFEFSQNHAMYWDKIERANYFLDDMIQLADTAPDDRLMAFLLEQLMGDGGQWNMEVSVFAKHGAVPKELMPETESSANTARMNSSLRTQLRRGARMLRQAAAADAASDELQRLKEQILADTHRILTIHLGVPPTEFEWQWRDDERQFHRAGSFTPQSFLAAYTDIDLADYVCLVDDPRPEHPKGAALTVAHLGNVVGGDPVVYLNVDIDLIKRIAAQTIVDGEPVWFGCDVGPQMARKDGLWAADLFDYAGVYGVDLSTTKEERVRFGESAMTHAMLFTGVDLDEDGAARRWRVENSWGTENADKGFYTMAGSWFDEYVFEVVVRKDRLPAELQAALTTEPLELPAWDPMGALA
ncbi:aminopeptidase C [Microbacterium elymi]|uniref:Aminopeptidase n=1 Tax=Microbacterium elymi TaxID=2909587 RepID=A0ABY5NNF3_9MICO|nr:C1 family peptidase [Microbacterium elymi]UUT36609.1 C1 family peptidase [Microbacterium elymi]